MPSEQDIKEQQELLYNYRRTLSKLLNQRAQISASLMPPAIANGIDEARDNIHRIKQNLRTMGVSIDDHQNDDEAPPPPLVSIGSVSFPTTNTGKSSNIGLYIGVFGLLVAIVAVGFVLFSNIPHPTSPVLVAPSSAATQPPIPSSAPSAFPTATPPIMPTVEPTATIAPTATPTEAPTEAPVPPTATPVPPAPSVEPFNLVGDWQGAPSCTVKFFFDDGKTVKGTCDNGQISHLVTGTYIDKRTIAISIRRTDQNGCETTVDGSIRFKDKDTVVMSQAGWNGCEVRSAPTDTPLTRKGDTQ